MRAATTVRLRAPILNAAGRTYSSSAMRKAVLAMTTLMRAMLMQKAETVRLSTGTGTASARVTGMQGAMKEDGTEMGIAASIVMIDNANVNMTANVLTRGARRRTGPRHANQAIITGTTRTDTATHVTMIAGERSAATEIQTKTRHSLAGTSGAVTTGGAAPEVKSASTDDFISTAASSSGTKRVLRGVEEGRWGQALKRCKGPTANPPRMPFVSSTRAQLPKS